MDEVQERCVLLQNLPPNCTVANITEMLDQTHGNISFLNKYEKIDRHMDSVRWIVLFRTKNDAEECIKSGEWECSVLGETCLVKPECCPQSFIPDEWLQNTSSENDNMERLTEESGDDLREGTMRAEDEFKSFVAQKKKTAKEDDTTTEANFNMHKEVGNVSLNELFGSEKGKKDMSKQFSDSVRSADMFGSGFESTNFSYNKDIGNSDIEDDILKRRYDQILDDSVENPELFGSDHGYVKMSVTSAEMCSSENDVKTGTDHQDKTKYDKQNFDGSIPLNQRQKNTVPKPQTISAENQHNKTFIGSDKIADSCSSRYSDALPIQGIYVITSSSESSSASQRQTLNVPQPQSYSQFPMVGDFGHVAYPGVHPSMHQNILPYFIPNENCRLPYPPFYTMQQMQQFPVFYPMPYPIGFSGLQYHGTMPGQLFFVPAQPENNDNQGNTYDIPKNWETGTINQHESEKHIYHEIDDIQDTRNDDDEAHNTERASNRIEEPNKSEKWHMNTRYSGRALPPLPGSRTSDISTGSRMSDSSSGIWSSDSSARSRTFDISTGSRTSDCSPGSLTSDNSTAAKKRSSNDSNPPLRNSGESDRKEVNDDIEEIGERMKGENKRILVKGLSDVITKDDLESYFKARQIGGGDIVFSEIDGKKRHAIIEYKSEIDAREVIKRASTERTYNLKGCNLEVLEYVPPSMDPLKLFIQGIDDITTDEGIVSFTEEICKLPSKVKRGGTPGTAMLCFDVAPDLEHIQKTCETRKCDGCNWQISPVEQTRSVQISLLNSQISKDALLSYFENEQLSDGGPVESVIFRADRKDWIVTFMRAEDAERTQRKGKHDVDGQTIEVQLHYPCLELDEEYIVKIPDPLLFDAIDEHICKFLQSSPKYRSMIENGVSSQHGRVIWDAKTEAGDTCIQIVCIVDQKDKHGKKKVKYWTENCRLEVTDVVDTLTVKRSQNIAVEEWSHVKSRIGEISVADPQYVAIAFADSECVVVVSGEEQHVIEDYNQIKLILGEVEDKLNSENPVITKKLRFEMYELELVRQSKLEDKFRKKLEGFYIDEERSEFTFKGKQKAVDHALTKLRSKLQSFVSTSVPGFTSEAKRLLVKSRAYISAKIKQEKIMCVWNVPKNSDVVLYGTDEKDVDRAAQILQNLIKVDSIQLDQSKANFIHSAEGEAKLRFLKENNTTTFSCSLLQYELRFACFAQIYDEVKSTIADLLDSQNVVSHFIPTDIGICSFIIQYKRAELNNIEKRYRVGLEPVGIEQIQGFTVKGDDGCRLRLAIIELLKVIDSVVHKDLKLAWPGLDKYLKSREGLDEMKQIELNEKCVLKVLFEESTLPKGSQKQNDNAEVGSGPHKHQESDMQPSKINKRVVLGTLAAEKTDVIVNSTNFNLDMNVGGISRSLLKAGGDQLGIECKTKYPDGITVGEIAVTSGGSLNCKHLFHGVLIKWDGAQGHAERVMIHFIKACLEHAHTYELESISFPALGTGNLVFPAEVVAQIMNDVVDEFGTDNPNTSLKLVNFVIRHEDTEIAKAFECYSVNRSIHRTREVSSRRYTTMDAEKIIMQGGNLHTTIDNVSIIVEQGDITKTLVGAIVNSTVEDLNLNSGAISKAILRAAGSSIQKEASSKKNIFDSKGLVVTRQGRLTMCQKILHIRARNGHKGWTESIQQCLTEIENLGLNSVAFPALGTGGKGVPAEQMAKTMIEAFQDFIKSPKYKGSLRTIRIVIFHRKMLETFVAVIKTALDPQQKKGFFHFLERKSLYANTTLYTTVHIYAGCSQYIDSAISKIEAIRRDEAVAICSSVRITFNDCYAKDLQKIAHRHGVQVIVGKGEVKVIGYGKAADAAITEVDKYLKDLETHIEKNKELSTSNT